MKGQHMDKMLTELQEKMDNSKTTNEKTKTLKYVEKKQNKETTEHRTKGAFINFQTENLMITRISL